MHLRHITLLALSAPLAILSILAGSTTCLALLVAHPLAQDPPAPAPLPVSGPPCALEAERAISPRIVEAGQPLTISVSIHYDCTVQPPPALDLVFAVEDTAALIDENLSAGARADSLSRLKVELTELVDGLEPANGSRIGLYRADLGGPSVALASGSAAFDATRSAISDLKAEGACHRRATTVHAISRALADADDPDHPTVVIYLATAAPPCTGGGTVPPPGAPSLGEACDALKAQATLALIDQGGGAMRGCNSPGWYYRVSDPNLETPAVVHDLTNRLIHPDRPLSLLYAENLDPLYFDYEFGSGNPSPNSDGKWPFLVAEPWVGTHRLQFRITALAAPSVVPVSLPPGPLLSLKSRSQALTWHLPNPDVCIYRPGRRAQDCAPNPIVLSPTPTPTASATPQPTRAPSIYIPRAVSH